jgi:hypothetical protein
MRKGLPLALDPDVACIGAEGACGHDVRDDALSKRRLLARSEQAWRADETEVYGGDGFVVLRGSWNRTRPSGYKVMRIRFENGTPVAAEDFLTGFT